ncbi:GNAT family N-acetyltransferase [Zeaxanthinibacter sp. PT1]|uniref:GNAT family N-acetyltransferase n=1 Tax=Zeaxanthinibacter TaxID=561554 RepID=UPI00234BBA6E|nr:GNAT family N-acetyltransferase [Zeaxanthinibacter sp. PT1]MDC6351059.1 GNAT family N-acetyltransferase [Zeaxanthinibacter sp. PT1]
METISQNRRKMGIIYRQAHSADQLEQILELQRENLVEVLTEEMRTEEGFVSLKHSLELLAHMNAVCPHIVALDGDRVIGYALSMHPSFSEEIPLIQPMFKRVKGLLAPGTRFMVMGQVCIAKDYRKKGIFRGLYHRMQVALKNDFEWIITEVDDRNQRSLNAHYAVGFTDMEVYESDGRTWHLIGLPTASSS